MRSESGDDNGNPLRNSFVSVSSKLLGVPVMGLNPVKLPSLSWVSIRFRFKGKHGKDATGTVAGIIPGTDAVLRHRRIVGFVPYLTTVLVATWRPAMWFDDVRKKETCHRIVVVSLSQEQCCCVQCSGSGSGSGRNRPFWVFWYRTSRLLFQIYHVL